MQVHQVNQSANHNSNHNSIPNTDIVIT